MAPVRTTPTTVHRALASATASQCGLLPSVVLYACAQWHRVPGPAAARYWEQPSDYSGQTSVMADQGTGHGAAHPRFYKFEFPTYDGSADLLNWLSQCKQFFRGQRTQASDRTWMASYHLTGTSQMWYYALEQDEGMPPRDRFKELCHDRFGPTV